MKPQAPSQYVLTASDAAAVAAGCYWSQAAIDHVMRFAATLRDPTDPQKPYKPLKWQRRLIDQLFGWRRPDGRRRFTRLNLWVPKKNGKTSLLAFLALVFLCVDGEKRPGCYVTSATGELAEETYRECLHLTAGTAWRRLMDLQNFRKRLRFAPTGGELRALAASAEGAEGVKGSFVCLDEIHVTLRKKPALYGSLRYAGSGRRQPLTATISTAGDDQQSLPYKIYSRAKRILAGEIIDLHTLAVVYEAEERDEYTPEELAAANPAVGELLELQQLIDDYHEAKTSDYDFENFKRYRLNVWTKRSTAWMNVNLWLECGKSDLALPAGESCYVGVDLSSVLDLTAAVAVFPLADDKYLYWPHCWIAGDGLGDRRQHEMDYIAAEKAGHITVIPGGQIDYSYVEKWIEEINQKCPVAAIGFDPWRAAEIAGRLEKQGYQCLQVKQGWGLSEPMHKLESCVRNKTLLHTANSVMSWCIENVQIRMDNNGKIRPVKPPDRRKRIDLAVAAIMGQYLAMFAPKPEKFIAV